MKTLVIGLGNPILGDDGVGWCVAEEVRRCLPSASEEKEIEVDCFALGGLSLMERLVGYDRAVIIDAIRSGQPPGSVACFRLEDLPDFSSAHTSAAHDTSLQNALKVGRAMSVHLPGTVVVVAIEAQRVYDFSETLSPPVATAVPVAARKVLGLLEDKPYGFP
jgi:hydrogenase maturation protease